VRSAHRNRESTNTYTWCAERTLPACPSRVLFFQLLGAVMDKFPAGRWFAADV
jgi:hypothetical protein